MGDKNIWIVRNFKKGQIVFGGYPGQSAFDMDLSTVLPSKLNRTTLFQSLQIVGHAVFGYRPAARAYRVMRDSKVLMGYTHANPHLGQETDFRTTSMTLQPRWSLSMI